MAKLPEEKRLAAALKLRLAEGDERLNAMTGPERQSHYAQLASPEGADWAAVRPKLHDTGVLSRGELVRGKWQARKDQRARSKGAEAARAQRWEGTAEDRDAEQRPEVERMWRTTRLSERAIARRLGISPARVARILGPKSGRQARPD